MYISEQKEQKISGAVKCEGNISFLKMLFCLNLKTYIESAKPKLEK